MRFLLHHALGMVNSLQVRCGLSHGTRRWACSAMPCWLELVRCGVGGLWSRAGGKRKFASLIAGSMLLVLNCADGTMRTLTTILAFAGVLDSTHGTPTNLNNVIAQPPPPPGTCSYPANCPNKVLPRADKQVRPCDALTA